MPGPSFQVHIISSWEQSSTIFFERRFSRFTPGNSSVDVSPLSNLAGLKQLDLSDNQIENIAPLLVEPGLGRGDLLDITSNPLETFDGTIGKAHIDLLIQRGVGVLYDPIQVVDGAVQTCERKPL